MQEILRWLRISNLGTHQGAMMVELVQDLLEQLKQTHYSDILKLLEESAKLLKLHELQKVELMQHSGS